MIIQSIHQTKIGEMISRSDHTLTRCFTLSWRILHDLSFQKRIIIEQKLDNVSKVNDTELINETYIINAFKVNISFP